MPKSSEGITLYGEEAEEFRRLQEDVLPDGIGWVPANAKTVAFLMAHFDEQEFATLLEDVDGGE
jgi:hypothetical protein